MAAITSSTIRSNLLALSMGVFPIAINQLVQRVFAQKTSPLKLQAGSLMASSVAYLILAQKLPTCFRLGAPVLFLAYKVALKHWNEQNSPFNTQDEEGELPTTPPPVTSTPDKGKPGILYQYKLLDSTFAAALHSATSSINIRQGEDDGLEKPPALVDEPSGSKGETTQHSITSTTDERRSQDDGLKSAASTNETTTPPDTSTVSKPRRQRRNVVLHKTPASTNGTTPPIATSAATVAETLELPQSVVTTLEKKTVSLASLVTPPKLEPFPPATKAEKTLTDQLFSANADTLGSVREFEKLLKKFRASEKRVIRVKASPIVPGEAEVEKDPFKATIYFGETHLFKFDKVRVDALKTAGYNVTEETLFFWIEVKKNGEEKKLTTVNLIPLEMLKTVKTDTQNFSLILKDEGTEYTLSFDNQISKLKSFAAKMRRCTQIRLVPKAIVNLTLSLKSPDPIKHQEIVIGANNYAAAHHAKCYLEPFMTKV